MAAVAVPLRHTGVADSVGANRVTAVFVNYNAGDYLTRAVRAVLAGAGHVVVVDNASHDNSLPQLQRACDGDGRVRIVRSGRNLGFAAGCNAGLGMAETRYVLFLNPDCEPAPEAIGRLVAAMETEPTAAMAGGLPLGPDGTEQAGGRRAVPTPWRAFVRAFGLYRLGRRYPRLFSDFVFHRQPLPDGPTEVEAISGCCMLVRREAIEEVGPLDEGYFLHCEDLDWCMRFRQQGWKILFVPDAKILHHKGVSSRGRPIFAEWHKHKGMIRFYGKFFRYQYPGALMWLVTFGVWLRFGAVAGHLTVRRMSNWVKDWGD